MPEFGAFMLIVSVVGSIIFLYWFRESTKDIKHRTEYQFMRKTHSEPTSSEPTESRLSISLKTDKDITSNQITLVTQSLSNMDEFYGSIKVLDGLVDENTPMQSAQIYKMWRFLGYVDKYSMIKQRKDFANLINQYKTETDNIVEEFRDLGWAVEQVSNEPSGAIYHLTR